MNTAVLKFLFNLLPVLYDLDNEYCFIHMIVLSYLLYLNIINPKFFQTNIKSQLVSREKQLTWKARFRVIAPPELDMLP